MTNFQQLRTALTAGTLVPILGPGALEGSVDPQTQQPIPADNRSLILAMNNGREMMPRLMYEFSRAAQHVEQRRGQAAVARFLNRVYNRPWTRAPLHDALAAIAPHWVVDLNRDLQLLESNAGRPHTLILGTSRIMEKAKRFLLFEYDGSDYSAILEDQIDTRLPILFKPLGAPLPEQSYIASDADFVDYLTELMGGFAIPDFIKTYRTGKQYLLLGVSLNRDTERMLVSDISYGASKLRGWVFLSDASDKERRFCQRMQLEIIDQPLNAFTQFLIHPLADAAPIMRATEPSMTL
tara:strand:+ start:1357 stop:2241 length:885 start_codon:yes stop_codon:yes gene_type:complete